MPGIRGKPGNDHQGAGTQSHQDHERQEQAAPRTDSQVTGGNDPPLRIAGRHLVEALHDLPAVGTTAEMSFDQGRLGDSQLPGDEGCAELPGFGTSHGFEHWQKSCPDSGGRPVAAERSQFGLTAVAKEKVQSTNDSALPRSRV